MTQTFNLKISINCDGVFSRVIQIRIVRDFFFISLIFTGINVTKLLQTPPYQGYLSKYTERLFIDGLHFIRAVQRKIILIVLKTINSK